jgi:hypothetical protein
MIYLSDRDVVLKLASCGFLPLLPELLDVSESELEVRYLASLKGNLQRMSQRLGNPEFQEALAGFCHAHSVVDGAASVERQQELLDGGMDPGEALLFAEAEQTGGIVVTGDKRALRDYKRLSSATHRRKLKVICWEQLLLRIHETKGYERLKSGCCEGISSDGLLSLAFSSGLATREDHAIGAITSYLGGVEEHSSDILFRFDS